MIFYLFSWSQGSLYLFSWARDHLSGQHPAAVLVDANDDAHRLLVQHHQIMQVILAKPATQPALLFLLQQVEMLVFVVNPKP